mmetsp:Transcript_25369/g.37462  ORF Transcript_25369/g.37462 Transcript_25369/m.37462 type:complete len:829 (+) Transcript_25369:97-2583(+)
MKGIESNSLESRLESVKVCLRKATETALKAASSRNPLQPKLNYGENDNINSASSESFSLGMTLFGKENSDIERDIQDNLTTIESELSQVLKEFEKKNDGSLEIEEPDEAVSKENLDLQAQQLKTRIEFLKICSVARANLEEATTVTTASPTNDPDYVAAAEMILNAKNKLASAENLIKEEECRASSPTKALLGAHRILDSIRTGIYTRNLDISGKVSHLVQTSVLITSNSISIKGKRSNKSNAEGLYAAFEIIEKLSLSGDSSLHRSIQKLVDQLVVLVVKPILHDFKNGSLAASPWSFFESSNTGSICFEWKQDNEDPNVTTPSDDILEIWKHVFCFLKRTLAFFQSKVLLGRPSLCNFVGDRLFTRTKASNGLSSTMRALGMESKILNVHSCSIIEPIIDLLSDNCIPNGLSGDKPVDLDDIVEKITNITGPFDEEMDRLQFYSNCDTPTQLSKFVSSFHQNYIEKRRNKMLSQARKLLLNNDYHDTVEVGDEISMKESAVGDGSKEEDETAIFRLHKCAVSKTATLILSLCCQTMEEAIMSSKSNASDMKLLPATMYKTAREILDMFRAIIPTKFEKEVSTVPRTAAILHNDCAFFAHHCLTLGLRYKDKFPSSSDEKDIRGRILRQTCVFVDMVPIFREIADQAMGDMLQMQHVQLLEIVGSRIGMFGESLSSNESLSEWVDAETAMKGGVYHVKHLSQAWGPILSRDVHRRSVGFLMDTIFNLYLDQCFRVRSISEPARHLVGSVFRLGMQGALEVTNKEVDGCLAWGRFSTVGRFMDMSLADINVGLSDGVFRSITGAELSSLIKATFGDCDKRQKILDALN